MHFPLRREAAVVSARINASGNNDYSTHDRLRGSPSAPMHPDAPARAERSRRVRPAGHSFATEGLRQVARMSPGKSRQSCESLMKELIKLHEVRRNLQEQVEMKKKQVQALDRFVERLGQPPQETPSTPQNKF